MKAAAAALALKALTFNAAGIPLVHERVSERVVEAARRVKAEGYDLVGLQELWFDGDAAAFQREAGLEGSARAGGPWFGSGLMVLSRWPVVATAHAAFSAVRPSLRHPLEGEALADKGWLMARVATPKGELDVYSAHTVADYPEAHNRFIRLTELYELSEAIREHSAGRAFVVLGDLNSGRGDPEFDAFMDLLGLADACEPRGREACADPDRTRRIDHILTASPLAAKGTLVLAGEPRLSDHFGFAADLGTAVFSQRLKPDPKRRAAALAAVADACDGAIKRLFEQTMKEAWVPLVGAGLSARYALQIRRLEAIRERATRGL